MKKSLTLALILFTSVALLMAQTFDNNGRQIVNVEPALPTGNNNIGDVDVASLPSVTVGVFPDNEPFNLAQVAGSAVATGNGTAAGSVRVSVASDSTGQINVLLPNEGQQTAANSISVTPDTDNDAVGAAAAAPPGEYVALGVLGSGATGGQLQPLRGCDSWVAVNISTATTTSIITGVSGRHVYLCSVMLVTAAANNVAFIAGTQTTNPCDTSAAGLSGGTTAASGFNFAANGGLTISGSHPVMSTTQTGGATGDSVCIVTSAATQLSGSIGYTIQ